MASYAITHMPTPVFNIPNPGEDLLAFSKQKEASSELWRPLETILFPGTPLLVENGGEASFLRISTPAYPGSPLFVHRTCLCASTKEQYLSWKQPPLPSLATFLKRIEACLNHIPYLWGGNAPEGNPFFSRVFSEDSPASTTARLQNIWDLRGVDCSGLLYWASEGALPRNTGQLLHAGKAVPITGLCPEDLSATLSKPGLIVVWKGHVIVSTRQGLVESTPELGVHRTPTREKVQELLSKRVALNGWPLSPPSTPSFIVRDLDLPCLE